MRVGVVRIQLHWEHSYPWRAVDVKWSSCLKASYVHWPLQKDSQFFLRRLWFSSQDGRGFLEISRMRWMRPTIRNFIGVYELCEIFGCLIDQKHLLLCESLPFLVRRGLHRPHPERIHSTRHGQLLQRMMNWTLFLCKWNTSSLAETKWGL